jgi:N,N'-diacetyllegionaminate synthase
MDIKERKTFIIAEAGVNHNGSVEMARNLIREAKRCGADCVKFQTFRAERIVTNKAPKAQYQMQTTDPSESQLDMLKQLELPEKAYPELMRVCSEEGIMFLSTPYDIEDIEFLYGMGVEAFKVASGQIVEPYFLEVMAGKGKPMIVSTGMASMGEVSEAVRIIKKSMSESGKKHSFLPELCLLQCTTDYPAILDDANLRAMQSMGRTFGLPVGYSDHTEDSIASIVAVALGAQIIEKHFTLDRNLPGPDQSCSFEPNQFEHLVKDIRKAERVLGSCMKEPSPREIENARTMRRSIVASHDLPAGKILALDDIAFKRPLSGLPADCLDVILGKRIRKAVKKDGLLDLEIIS